mgnify:CR=1 FL=1
MNYFFYGFLALVIGSGTGYCMESYRAGFIITLVCFIILGIHNFIMELDDDL